MPTEAFIALLIEALVKTMPSGMGAADREANLSIARTLFEAYRPADAKEAALAARAIAAHFAAMDGFARAARPGLSDDTAIRLRVSAIAASRLSDALTRPRQQPRQPVADTTVPIARRRRRPHHAGIARAASGRTAAAGRSRRGDTARRHRPVAGSTDSSRARVERLHRGFDGLSGGYSCVCQPQ